MSDLTGIRYLVTVAYYGVQGTRDHDSNGLPSSWYQARYDMRYLHLRTGTWYQPPGNKYLSPQNDPRLTWHMRIVLAGGRESIHFKTANPC